MSSRLVNVRLDADAPPQARILCEGGIALSDVVREAIDERYGALRRTSTGVDVIELVRIISLGVPRSRDTSHSWL